MTHDSHNWSSLDDNLFAESFILEKFNFFVEFQGQSFYGVNRKKLKLVRIRLSWEFLQPFQQNVSLDVE